MSEKVFGIDLGTTYSAVAHINEYGQPEVIPNLDGQQTTPSVVYFEDSDNFVVGQEAKNGMKVYPDDTKALIKRQMGEKHTLTYHGKDFTPESISALILRQLVEAAQEMTDSDSKQVVITVPAYFGLVEKEATRNAGKIAGLDVVGILAEPIAAALSAGIKPGEPQTVLVYDLGGGTFDTTVMDLNDNGVDVLAVDGDRKLGGADWDNRLFQLVLDKFMDSANLDEDPSFDPAFYQDLLSNVEDAKKTLSRKKTAKVRCSYETATEMIEVTREEFDAACVDLVDQTVTVVKRTIDAAKQKKNDLNIDKFLLVGGSSRMPMIEERLSKELNRDLTKTEFDLAVAKGAAIYGQGAMDFAVSNGSNSGEEETGGAREFYIGGASDGHSMTINNLLSKSVGVQFMNPNTQELYVEHLLNQGDTLPAQRTITARTLADNSTSIEVHLYEQAGEVPSEELEANKEITPDSGAVFVNLPNLPKGSPIEMTMSVDSEGLLTFTGFEPKSNQTLKLEVTVSTMQPAEVEQAAQAIALMNRGE